jgi:4-hydroxy-tetrahydrodipicolinate synthase
MSRPKAAIWEVPMSSARLSGVFSPVVTPFKADLTPDPERYVAHCRWLLRSGCDGLAVFGTNSEANSLTLAERMELLEALAEGGVEVGRLMPGTGCCSIMDSVTLTRHAVSLGCGGVLMLPPFYYKGVSDEGIYRSIAEVAERCADDRLRIYLYHIPPVAQVGFSHEVVGRLLKDCPGIVVGMKDSCGDWAHTRSMIESFPGFDVFSGNELNLVDNLNCGGVGCITATANVRPGPIGELYARWQEPDAADRQEAINATRVTISKFPVIPALKALIGHYSGEPGWRRMRPPLVALTDEQVIALVESLKPHDFAMPGLPGATAEAVPVE